LPEEVRSGTNLKFSVFEKILTKLQNKIKKNPISSLVNEKINNIMQKNNQIKSGFNRDLWNTRWRNTQFPNGGPFGSPDIDEIHSSFCLEAMEIINFIKYICVSFNITYMNNFLEYIYIFQRNTN